jgi:hypothetical protein
VRQAYFSRSLAAKSGLPQNTHPLRVWQLARQSLW